MSARSCTATCPRLERTPKELQHPQSNQRPHDQLMQRSSCLRSSQQKVQPRSRMEISRGSQVVRGFLEDRQDHRRNHVEGNPTNVTSGLLAETTQQRVRRTTTHQQLSTSWRSAAEASWTQQHTGASRQGHPRYTRADFGQEAVGGSTSRKKFRWMFDVPVSQSCIQ